MNFDKKTDSISKSVFLLLVCLFILAIGFFIGSVFFPQTSTQNSFQLGTSSTQGNLTDFSKFNNVVQIINDKFYYRDRLSSTKIQDNSIKGMLSGLEDFPTRYLNTSEYSQYKETIAGNIYGIGIEIGVNGDGSKVTSVYPDTPASKADVKKGDIILKVDNKDTSKLSPGDVATLIRGQIGTDVKLVLGRDGNNVEKTITRDKIYTNSVSFENLNDNGICKIQIQRFTDDTVDKWKDNWNNAVSKFQSDKCTKLIVDLRGNGGGYVEAAKYAIGEFIADGTTIYGQKKPDGTVDKVVSDRDSQARSNSFQSSVQQIGHLRDVPMTVLINSTSASASEIFSGSLQALGRAKLVGTNSFGKGSVQDTTEFSDGSSLIYTIANWTLPTGQVIDQNFPIKPDEVVSAADAKADTDPQLDKAKDLLM